MSLDNVIAIAGVKLESDPVRLTVGLVLSITMVLGGFHGDRRDHESLSLDCLPGHAVLALTAASMMIQDFEILYRSRMAPGADARFPRWAAWTVRIAVLIISSDNQQMVAQWR